jgi:O-antigen/teichoic acid export membrane protein
MALLRHSGIYFLARILAGGAAFAIIAAYTRLLDPHAFGELALSLAGVAFFAVLIIEGPMLAMLRYLPGHSVAARATTLWGLILPAVAICCVATVGFLLAAPERWRVQLALCAGLLLASLLHQFQLAAAQGALRPGKYALLGSLESALDMVLGIGLVLLGYGVPGALLGTTLAALVAVAVNWRGWWINWKFFDPVLGRQMLRFGLPLIASAVFGWVAAFGDRWLLAYFTDVSNAGLYSAGYDVQMNLLGVPMIVMALAGVPLAISAYSDHGVAAAQAQLRHLGALIILVLLPEAVGIAMTAPLLTTIFLGPEFRPLATALLPLMAGAIFVKALLLYINYGYVLAGRSDLTLVSLAVAGIANLILSLILIPRFGPWGAAVASLLGFGAGFAVAIVKMRGVFAFPPPDAGLLIGGLLGVAAMTGFLVPFHGMTAWIAALYVIPLAILIYFGVVFLFLHFSGRQPFGLLHSLWTDGGDQNATS